MFSLRARAFAVTTASLAVGLAGVGAAADATASSASAAGDSTAGTPGGTLTYYIRSAYDYTDPQRIYVGPELTNFSRTVYRSLVAFPISKDPAVANKPVPDLATTTGTSSNHAKTWTFTLKDGIAWQDGAPVTCSDFKYGASRVFATDVITGGPNYLLTYLKIPTSSRTGLPIYTGPYRSSAAGRAAFNKAITCSGNTITYHFKRPWPDFPEAIAGLDMADPYRKDMDHGARSRYQIFSNGPYELQGKWGAGSGGTFVRNPHYDPSTDSTDVRMALPDRIVFDIGKQSETITKLLVADKGAARAGVTQQSVPSSLWHLITGSVAERAVTVKSPYVDYLVPNFKKLTRPKVRRALALATNRHAWVAAGGGPQAFLPAQSVVNPAVTGYRPNPAFKDIPLRGRDHAAKRLLRSAGVHLPYPIRFTYPSTPTSDAQADALKAGWKRAGFQVTLDGIANPDVYYTDVQNPHQKASLVWAGWGADWPSAITVTPPLFDSRSNLSRWSNGQDYGRYQSRPFNKLVDQAHAASSMAGQTKVLQKADALLGHDTAYIPVDIPVFYFLHGSGVTGYETTPASYGYPDLGSIGVAP